MESHSSVRLKNTAFHHRNKRSSLAQGLLFYMQTGGHTMITPGLPRRGLLIGSAAALAMPAAANAATLAEIKKRGYMTVATEDDFRPFEFTVDGKPTGYDQELLEAFKKKVGFERSGE